MRSGYVGACAQRRLVWMGMLVPAALALSFFENFLPLPVLPGAKLGLANLVTVIALCARPGASGAALVLAARVLLGACFAGGASFLYSAAGAALSMAAMAGMKRGGCASPVVLSAAGGFAHTLGQLFTAALLLSSPSLLRYLPVLGLAGLMAGTLIGLLAKAVLRRVDFAFPDCL